ncbi:hypothetical protein Tco_1295645, partial [Tanacetum coccineum]
MAQQIIPAAQLAPKFQGIRRRNNYDVLQSIPCSPECKIVGHILLDHPLGYALIVTADVSAVYLQQFGKTVSKLPVENPDNPFVPPVNKEIIESFMYTVGYQGVVDKVSALYTKFLAQLWQTMFKVFNRYLTTRTSRHDQTKINILQLFMPWSTAQMMIMLLFLKYPSISPRFEEDYHSLKDGILLVSVYTMGNVTVRGMLIPDAFLTKEICATDDYKEYETVFVNVVVLMNQPQLVVSSQRMYRSTPRAHRTSTLTAASP